MRIYPWVSEELQTIRKGKVPFREVILRYASHRAVLNHTYRSDFLILDGKIT